MYLHRSLSLISPSAHRHLRGGAPLEQRTKTCQERNCGKLAQCCTFHARHLFRFEDTWGSRSPEIGLVEPKYINVRFEVMVIFCMFCQCPNPKRFRGSKTKNGPGSPDAMVDGYHTSTMVKSFGHSQQGSWGNDLYINSYIRRQAPSILSKCCTYIIYIYTRVKVDGRIPMYWFI